MKRLFALALVCCSLAALLPLAAAAQGGTAAANPPAAAAGGFQTDLVADFDGPMTHLLQLADAMPADKYGWRPGEGVRSFSQVLMHVAAGNYVAAATLGVAVPAGVDPRKLEETTDKTAAVTVLRASIDQFKTAVAGVSDADLETPVELFGMKLNKRRVMLLMQGHGHEHLGQAIAYARVAGVVPPWSQPQPKSGG
jgi:uncharacterized damage-inducible protein DinB